MTRRIAAVATPDPEDELARLRAENARLKATKGAIKFKVGAKGGVSVYGLNARFPVTLYADQWERLIEAMPELSAFIDANRDRLSMKGDGT